MFRKAIWSIVLLGMSAYVFFGPEGGGVDPTVTPTGTIAAPTATLEYTATTVPTKKPTRTPTEVATAIPTSTSTAVFTPTTTNTAVPTNQPTQIPPTATLEGFLYGIQINNPVFMTNFVHTTEACNWQGVAGQVFDANRKPVNDLVIKITGTLGGRVISEVAVTGMVEGLPYGPGSYEITLGSVPVYSNNKVQIQVFSTEGDPLSAPVSFVTKSACNRNLIIINFNSH